MSEGISTAAAPAAAPSAPAGTSNQASGGSPGPGGGQAPQAANGQTQAPSAQAAQERFLAETDLDAYIEHTINGRKEKIKVRDALNGYGLDKVARQKISEANLMAKRQQDLNQLMHRDFDKWCEVTGTNRDEFLRSNLSKRKEIAEEILAREYELQQMDPHQRKNLELEQQLKSVQQRELATKQPLIDAIKEIVPADRLPKGLENATEGELREFFQARQQEFTQGVNQLSDEMLNAWQKVGLPRQKDFGSWMAQAMLDHQKYADHLKKTTGQEIEPLLPEQAAVKVKERFLGSTRSLFSQMDAPAIHEALGAEIIQKLRDHDVGLASSQKGPMFGNQNRPANVSASEPKRQLSQVEWRKEMGIA